MKRFIFVMAVSAITAYVAYHLGYAYGVMHFERMRPAMIREFIRQEKELYGSPEAAPNIMEYFNEKRKERK